MGTDGARTCQRTDAYDCDGNLEKTWDPNHPRFPDPPPAPESALDVAYVYDDPAVSFSLGRLTAVTRGGATVGYAYDRFGRMTKDGSAVAPGVPRAGKMPALPARDAGISSRT